MNLLITTDCNLACDYCFAGSLRQGHVEREMSLPELEQGLSYLDKDQHEVRLMGGEPTLHSQYAEILRSLKRRDTGWWFSPTAHASS